MSSNPAFLILSPSVGWVYLCGRATPGILGQESPRTGALQAGGPGRRS